MRIFLKNRVRKSSAQLDEIAKRLAADSKIGYPKGTRFRILDESILTSEGQAATRDGVLSLDEIPVEPYAKLG